jgi:UDP-N-acetylmuramoyl-tripeptide--D-alanyl-D-alanine ligase
MARELGVAEDAIQRGLEDVRPAAHRLVPIQHPSRPFLVLDDCYNSNPASCLAAVDTAVALAAPEDRLILVIGDMLELGEASEQAHTDLGAEIARRATRADVLVTVGPASRHLARSASAGGMATRPAANAEEALALVREYLRDGRATTLLAKASRGVALDRLVSALTEPD